MSAGVPTAFVASETFSLVPRHIYVILPTGIPSTLTDDFATVALRVLTSYYIRNCLIIVAAAIEVIPTGVAVRDLLLVGAHQDSTPAE